MGIVKRWLEDGLDVEGTILPVIAKRLADMDEFETVSSLAYFDAAIRTAHNLKAKRPARNAQPQPDLGVPDDDDPRVASIRDALRTSIGSKTYDGWLGPNRAAFSLNGSTALVTVGSDFARNWVEEHFAKAIGEATNAVAGIDTVKVIAK
jgi:hypothetical protein